MVSAIGLQPEEGLGDEDYWPPGFRFHPTDEELVLYYLKRKICGKRLKLDIIAVTDVYKWDPEELPGLALLKSGDRQWFFFTPRDRKYPNGARSNRATSQGYWKATGKDRCISCNSRAVGLKKTLVFYRGRAPSGERTDWVMHEYTLDEDELKRCQNIQEYYALYKVFKKSGPGPKNGEQYGAPFREEDWNHDCPDFNNSASRDISAKKNDEALPNGGAKVDCQPASLPDDIDELLENFTEDSLPNLPSIEDYTHTPSRVRDQEIVPTSTMVDLCINQEPVNVLYANGVQRNLQISFDLSQSTDTQLLSNESPVVASATPSFKELEAYVQAEDGFLEMDDLLGPEPVADNINVEQVLNDILVEDDGFCDLDLYHDAAMFLNDIGAGQGNVVNPHEYSLNHSQLGPGEVDQLYGQVSDEFVNQSYLGVDTITQLYANTPNQVNHQFFSDEASLQYCQEGSVVTSAEFYDDNYLDQTSVFGSSNNTLPANKNQSGNDNNGASSSWFSSAVWSFVESIPTTPASAAENALVNRAFERMSSFSRLRMNSVTANVSSGTVSEIIPKASSSSSSSSSKKRGLIFIPVLVAVIAVSWVVLGR